MCAFVSFVLLVDDAGACSSSNVALADRLEERPEVSCPSGHAAPTLAVSSTLPPSSTPSRTRSTDQERTGIPSQNFGAHFESPGAASPVERWKFAADVRSTDISLAQDSSPESSGSPPESQASNRDLLAAASGDCHGSNARCTISQIHEVPTALDDEVTSAARRSCALTSTPPRVVVVVGRPPSWPVVPNGSGSSAISSRAGVVARPSPRRNVKCGVRAEGTDALHWSSFHEPLDATRQIEHRLATAHSADDSSPSERSSSWLGYGLNFVRFCPNHRVYPQLMMPILVLRLREAVYTEVVSSLLCFEVNKQSVGGLEDGCGSEAQAFEIHVTVMLDSEPVSWWAVSRDFWRQLSQLRYPQQQQGVNESSEKTAFEPVSSFGNISLDPQSEERRQRQSHGGRSVQWPQLTEHFSVLGKFYFSTKVFPVFTTLRGNIVEVPFTAEELNERGSLPIEVNHYLWWYLDGLHCRPSSRRPLKRNAGTARSFKCFAHQSGKVSFQIMEEKNQASTLLPRVLAFDSVLKVYDEDGHQEHGRSRQVTRAQSETYHRLADRGIFAGLQHYMHCGSSTSEAFCIPLPFRFLYVTGIRYWYVTGDGKCYFDRTESRADADVQDPEFRQFTTIAKARCLCIHICRINTVFNYISRLQLLFSTTITMNMDRFVVKFGHLYDVRCKLVSYIQDWRFPWERIAIKSVCCTSKPTDFSSIELERALSDHFVQADSHLVYPRSLVATIANRWLKHMDPYVHTRDQHWGKKRGHLESALEVISPYKDSLKHAKTGKKLRVPDEGWPASRLHYLETNDRQPEGLPKDSDVVGIKGRQLYLKDSSDLNCCL
ncbi:hypothetical protein AXG93_2956s1140 [Marchantia polymorpha subsp. ruderalis]|uniref:Uncharacterized protein n=1 Tax=Marchantia polymorpha subsp. ruderalis TaxID=1480154 RepID=A0A176WC90_MARPO|nr:hypothetical protein AXG93_2956s1140 [Marchantia polymorpha subsp. ruderalis]